MIKYTRKSIKYSTRKNCKDREVCHPLQTNGSGKPDNIVYGASIGNTSYHFVNITNEIMLIGNTSRMVNRFIFKIL